MAGRKKNVDDLMPENKNKKKPQKHRTDFMTFLKQNSKTLNTKGTNCLPYGNSFIDSVTFGYMSVQNLR